MKRKAINKKLRFEIFERDKFICQYCGRTPDKDNVVLQVDHIVSVKNGGENEKENLITACWDCNIGKGAKTTIKGKMTPEDIREELLKTQDRLEQVVAMNKATKKISALSKKIKLEKTKWIDDELDGFNPALSESIAKKIVSKFNNISRDKIIEAIEITKKRDFEKIEDFVKYFSGVLRNISLSEEEQEILKNYNNFFYSKKCRMYSQCRKFILDNSFYGVDFHRDVILSVDKNIVNHKGESFKIRKEIQPLFNQTQFTIYNQSEMSLNIHICDTIQMLLDEV